VDRCSPGHDQHLEGRLKAAPVRFDPLEGLEKPCRAPQGRIRPVQGPYEPPPARAAPRCERDDGVRGRWVDGPGLADRAAGPQPYSSSVLAAIIRSLTCRSRILWVHQSTVTRPHSVV